MSQLINICCMNKVIIIFCFSTTVLWEMYSWYGKDKYWKTGNGHNYFLPFLKLFFWPVNYNVKTCQNIYHFEISNLGRAKSGGKKNFYSHNRIRTVIIVVKVKEKTLNKRILFLKFLDSADLKRQQDNVYSTSKESCRRNLWRTINKDTSVSKIYRRLKESMDKGKCFFFYCV